MAWKFHKHSLDIQGNKSAREAKWTCRCVRKGVLTLFNTSPHKHPLPPHLFWLLVSFVLNEKGELGLEMKLMHRGRLFCKNRRGSYDTSINVRSETTSPWRWEAKSSFCDGRESCLFELLLRCCLFLLFWGASHTSLTAERPPGFVPRWAWI